MCKPEVKRVGRSRRIFISYRRLDGGPVAGTLYYHLSECFGREHVFLDTESIPVGADFLQAVENALTRADVVIVVIGPAWAGLNFSGRRLD